MQAVIKNLTSEAFWLRLAFMLVFAVMAEIAIPIMMLLVLVQFVFGLFFGRLQAEIYAFSSSLSKFIFQAFQFLSYQTEAKPFPFNDWPKASGLPKQDES
ncbi:MAG TPA: DUF4389 domain-containing protein [Oceanospirillaceae bacterium]|nr:DUF4389 domain-containing protein [Oceanospirillaceae bacterium]